MLSKLLVLSVAAFSFVFAEERTSAPDGCLSVATDGSGDFTSFQSAVDSLSTTDTSAQCIFLDQGTYSEQVYIEERAAQLTIYGYTTDTSSYAGNGATVTSGLSQDDGLSNDETATVRAWATGLRIYNLNIDNSFGEGSQAVALSAQADQQGYYGVSLTGYQDTLLANTGSQVYASSFIEGATDFIFGQEAVAWFENLEINVIGQGYITANGRDSEDNPSYYVINNSNVDGGVGEGKTYLGRPWRNYSRVAFQNTVLSSVVNSAGWSIWNTGDERTDEVTYEEFNNSGDGAEGTRASFSTEMSSALVIEDILGDVSWVDSSYL